MTKKNLHMRVASPSYNNILSTYKATTDNSRPSCPLRGTALSYLPMLAFDLKQSTHGSSGSAPWDVQAFRE